MIEFMNKNKKKIWWIIPIAFFMPLIVVHIIYNINSPCDFLASRWSEDGILQYIAGFETLLGTITLGYISICQTEHANSTNDRILSITKESERFGVLPYFVLNPYLTKYQGNALDEFLNKAEIAHASENLEEETKQKVDAREDFLVSQIIFVFKEKCIEVKTSLSDDEKKRVESIWKTEKIATGGEALVEESMRYKKIQLLNCGKGAAVSVKCHCFEVAEEGAQRGDVYTIPFAVPSAQFVDIGFLFYSEECFPQKGVIDFTYADIYGNKYLQKVEITETSLGNISQQEIIE